ncbi:MAG TPA: methyltransferase, partial [Gemmatimonadales bacterium]|nr:methyltransferase [Gemmatimonadales bacterium]
MVEPTFGAPADFAAVRSFLSDQGYTAQAVSARVGVRAIHQFKPRRDGRTVGVELEDTLDLLIRLFMDAEVLPWATVRGRLPAPVVDALGGLGLLMQAASTPDGCHATALLYPTEGLFIVSDLTADPDPAAAVPLAKDVVYPAITLSSQRFLAMMPRTPCERFLELCAGTGIAALAAAGTAGHVWAADITDRATRFARFNAALNGIANFTAVQGDLYQPVAGQSFDRIVAHPPYVPAVEQRFIFRDGGADGEQITRGVLGGLAGALAPGGRFHGTCVLSDRNDARLEARVRGMLGVQEGEFDVLVGTMFEYEPADYFTRIALDGRARFEDMEPTLRVMHDLGVERLVYSHIEIQRRAAPRPVFTRRRQFAAANGPTEVDWLLGWESTALDPAAVEQLLHRPARVNPRTAVQVTLRPDGPDRWSQTESAATVDWPFPLRAKLPPWGADLLARCDGSTALGALLAGL